MTSFVISIKCCTFYMCIAIGKFHLQKKQLIEMMTDGKFILCCCFFFCCCCCCCCCFFFFFFFFIFIICCHLFYIVVNTFITKTCLFNFDPLKPHFYVVKLGLTEVYIFFLISAQKRRSWVLVRTTSLRQF